MEVCAMLYNNLNTSNLSVATWDFSNAFLLALNLPYYQLMTMINHKQY